MKKIVLVAILLSSIVLTWCGSSPSYNNTTSPSYNSSNSSNDWCCKHCSKGKACGDSCININYECHQPVGCACDS